MQRAGSWLFRSVTVGSNPRPRALKHNASRIALTIVPLLLSYNLVAVYGILDISSDGPDRHTPCLDTFVATAIAVLRDARALSMVGALGTLLAGQARQVRAGVRARVTGSRRRRLWP